MEFIKQLEEIEAKIYDAELALRSAEGNEQFNKIIDELYELRKEKKHLQAIRNKQIRQEKKV